MSQRYPSGQTALFSKATFEILAKNVLRHNTTLPTQHSRRSTITQRTPLAAPNDSNDDATAHLALPAIPMTCRDWWWPDSWICNFCLPYLTIHHNYYYTYWYSTKKMVAQHHRHVRKHDVGFRKWKHSSMKVNAYLERRKRFDWCPHLKNCMLARERPFFVRFSSRHF